MDLLVCGGAGYLGGFLSKVLVEQGHRVTVFDHLGVGLRSYTQHQQINFVEGNLLNEKDLYQLFKYHHFDGVFHMATLSPYSINRQNIPNCYRNNITGTMNLLDQMRVTNVDKIVFASSGLVYGSQPMAELDETVPTAPGTAFATTNVTIESMLTDFHNATGLNSVSLRFNNASGLAEHYHSYKWHYANPPELLRLLQSFQTADSPTFEVTEDKYPTCDDNSTKDYIHVLDVCDAFIKAMSYLQQGQQCAQQINLGSNGGLSYNKLLEFAQLVSGKTDSDIRVQFSTTPSVQTLSSLKAQRLLGWEPQYTVVDILQSLWQVMIKPQAEPIIENTEQVPEHGASCNVTVGSNKGLVDKLKFWARSEVRVKIAK
jgi:UDP-glucose 4-epimerase